MTQPTREPPRELPHSALNPQTSDWNPTGVKQQNSNSSTRKNANLRSKATSEEHQQDTHRIPRHFPHAEPRQNLPNTLPTEHDPHQDQQLKTSEPRACRAHKFRLPKRRNPHCAACEPATPSLQSTKWQRAAPCGRPRAERTALFAREGIRH